jgi:dihydroorotase
MSNVLVRGARLIDAATGIDMSGDLLVREGRIERIGASLESDGMEILDANGLIAAPGFIDLHTHLRDPGFEYKETIATGTLAAARGGFTTVCCMPNTNPPIDTRATVEYVLRTAATTGAVRVLPIGCVTRDRAGRELAELADLAGAGCVAFSDDGSPIADGQMMRRALEYSRISGRPTIDHCEDLAIAAGGLMHEGWVSTRLGLRAQSAAAEEAMVARDVALAAQTGAHVHFAHISTRAAVTLIRAAKARGLPVTAEVTPHHLTLTHEAVAFAGSDESLLYDTNAKVNPPLREPDDVRACVEGLNDGTIDAIATDHAPHADYEKAVEFESAPFGISSIETALGMCMKLVHDGMTDLPTLIERLTIGPARALSLDRFVQGIGTLTEGAPADVVLFDPDAEWTVDPQRFASKGRNTPLAGLTLRGRVVATLYAGRVAWAEERVQA